HRATHTTFPLSAPSALCLMFLIDAKHDIAHALLATFYAKFQDAPAPTHALAAQDFEQVCMACAAFFVLWRTSFREKYPDTIYRDLFRNYLAIRKTFPLQANETLLRLRGAFWDRLRALTNGARKTWLALVAQN